MHWGNLVCVMQIWLQKVQSMAAHNAANPIGAGRGINNLTDLTREE
jgi:hypothetical protein